MIIFSPMSDSDINVDSGHHVPGPPPNSQQRAIPRNSIAPVNILVSALTSFIGRQRWHQQSKEEIKKIRVSPQKDRNIQALHPIQNKRIRRHQSRFSYKRNVYTPHIVHSVFLFRGKSDEEDLGQNYDVFRFSSNPFCKRHTCKAG